MNSCHYVSVIAKIHPHIQQELLDIRGRQGNLGLLKYPACCIRDAHMLGLRVNGGHLGNGEHGILGKRRQVGEHPFQLSDAAIRLFLLNLQRREFAQNLSAIFLKSETSIRVTRGGSI